MEIRVPASTANLGCGFDSCGLAVNLFLTIEVRQEQSQWWIEHAFAELPHDETNLIIQTALRLVPTLKPRYLVMKSDIPPARGLGSSSAAIVAGIELANQLGELHLSQHEKLNIATEIEGHPDNVAPAIFGSLVVAAYDGAKVYAVSHQFPTCQLIACIPGDSLLTSESRQVLPADFSYPTAVLASSLANTMVAALLNNDIQLAGKIMEEDLWHEPYRAALIPHLEEIRTIAHQNGAYGTFLSGAGPTVMVVAPVEKTNDLLAELRASEFLGDVRAIEVATTGVSVVSTPY